jgi:hypothetical protein
MTDTSDHGMAQLHKAFPNAKSVNHVSEHLLTMSPV